MADIITYETLYELLRKEKYNQNLQELDKDFFKNIITYLEEKERLISQSPKDSAFSREITTTKKQVENAKKLIKELYERRENKIIQFALLSSRSASKESLPLLQVENGFYADVQKVLDKYRKEILENVLSNQQPIIKEVEIVEPPKTIKTEKREPPINKLVRFVQPTPQFVSTDLNVYGPYEREDISLVPQKIANILIKKKRVEEMKIEKK